MEAVRIPPHTDNNDGADYWRYQIGANVIPANSKEKVTYITWKQSGYQDNPISEEQHNEWKRTNAFAEGIAVITGKVWRGEHAGEYFTCIDCDNKLAIDEFCTRNGQTKSLKEVAEKFLVEQHLDNPNKAHLYFYSDNQLVARGSSINTVGKEKIENNEVPGFEIKSTNKTIAFCTPSMHKGGHRYEIIGTADPIVFGEKGANELMQHLNDIPKKYGMQYLNSVNRNDSGSPKVAELVKEGAVVFGGNNRHGALVQMGMSVYSYLRGKYPLSTIKEIVFRVLNDIYCVPPLDKKEFEGNVWKSILRYIPPEQKYEDSARKHLEEIASDKGIDPNKVLEKPLGDVMRRNYGQYTISNAKIVGVSPPYRLISKVTLTCSKCSHEEIEDYSKMPIMSYKQKKRMCDVCVDEKGRPQGDLNDQYDHVDAKSITLQDAEMCDDLERLHVILLEDLTRNVRVGETVTITGDMTVLNPSGAGNKKPNAVMYARHIRYDREEEAPITDDDITLFRDFVKEHGDKTPDELVKMFAPQVIGHDDAKLGLLRSAVCVIETKHLTALRSRTHTDLAGDPGTVKSTLGKQATLIVPNSRWVTAQHVSIKSVLAIIQKDPDGGKMLMLGAIPQARGALCGINEIGSMPFEDQQHLADILEEGRFTIDKHGIFQEIESPTTIIATTNPEGGRWNGTPSLDKIPIRTNIKDRFDQTYIFQDFQTTQERREYVMQKGEHYQDPESIKPDDDFLKRYLQYAALLPDPVLTPEATTMLSDFWIRMSEAGYASNRSYDSLIRIARGQARLQLKSEIDAEIAKQVTKDIELMFVKLGKKIDPSVESPIEIAYNEVIQYTNTLQAPLTVIEAIKHVWGTNNSIKQYLGGNSTKWAISENKRLRHVHDRFSDGAVVGQIKTGRNGLAIAIERLTPLTIVKVDKETAKQRQQPQPEQLLTPQEPPGHTVIRSYSDTVIEESKREMSENDQYDRDQDEGSFNFNVDVKASMTPPPKPYQLVEKAMRDNQGNNKGYFTKDDFVYAAVMEPNWHCTEDQAEQVFYALIEEGKMIEIEQAGGKYKLNTTQEEKEE